MTGTTISSYSTLSLNLTAASQNPVRVTTAGTISSAGNAAIYGTAGIDWNIANAGLLRSTYANGSGIKLAGNGTVSNTGTIKGAPLTNNEGSLYGGNGISLSNGAVTNGSATDTTALISGADAIFGNSVNVMNFGTVASIGHQTFGDSGPGISLNSGTVTNGTSLDTTARVSGFSGIVIEGSESSAVTNFGTVAAGTTVAGRYHVYIGTGVYLDKGTVINGSEADTSALIRGGVGVRIVIGSGTVSNYGTIVSTDTLAGTYVGAGVFASSVVNGSAHDTTALISAAAGGVGVQGGDITNYGSIVGGSVSYRNGISIGRGVSFELEGSLTNGSATDTSALISGAQGVYIPGGGYSYSQIDNFGTILSSDNSPLRRYGSAVQLQNEGRVVNGSPNDTVASIIGYRSLQLAGIARVSNYGDIGGSQSVAGIAAGFAYIYNSGTVQAGAGIALGLAGGGQVTNATGATITGRTGIVLAGGATLEAGGTIIGAGGTAIDVVQGTARIVLQPGASIQGAVTASSGTSATLEFAAGSGTLAAPVTNFGSIVLDSNANWALAAPMVDPGNLRVAGTGTLALAAGGLIEVGTSGSQTPGALTVDARHTLTGAGTIKARVLDNGLISATGTLTLDGAVSGKGSIGITHGAVLTVDGVLGVRTLTFLSGGHETLKLGRAGAVPTRFAGFDAGGNTIDLLGVVGTVVQFAGGVLSVHGPSGSVATLHLTGNYTSGFTVGSDHHGGTLIRLG